MVARRPDGEQQSEDHYARSSEPHHFSARSLIWLRSAGRELTVLSLFVALSILMTWPLAMHLDRAIRSPDDPFFTTWAMDWDYYATFHRGVHLFDADIVHPAKHALAFSEHMYGVALLFFPLFALGVPPLTIHNIALLLGFAFNGYAAFALCRHLIVRADAALIGGIAYAFIGFRFHHLPHLHFVWTPWLALMLLALLRYARMPSVSRAMWLAVALVMNGLNSLHWLVFGSIAIALTTLIVGAKWDRLKDARFWIGIALAGFVAAVILWPFIQPYREVASLYGMRRGYSETITNSAYWHDWLAPNLQNKL